MSYETFTLIQIESETIKKKCGILLVETTAFYETFQLHGTNSKNNTYSYNKLHDRALFLSLFFKLLSMSFLLAVLP